MVRSDRGRFLVVHAGHPAVPPPADPLRRAAESLGFSQWPELLTTADAARRFVARRFPVAGLSAQRLASAYEAAFSIEEDLWPAACGRFFETWAPRFEELYSHRESAGTELSVTSDLARKSCFVAIRSGLRWHAEWQRRGGDPRFQWCAFELTNLATEIRRHWSGLDVRLPAFGIESASRSGLAFDSAYEQLRRHRREAVRRVLADLAPDTQRVLRMTFGFFPCTNPYSVDRIAATFGRPAAWAQAVLHQGLAHVADALRPQVSGTNRDESGLGSCHCLADGNRPNVCPSALSRPSSVSRRQAALLGRLGATS
jgi:hypothetical protein